MSKKTRFARGTESIVRERVMRRELAPLVLKTLGQITSDCTVRRMQLVTVQPPLGPARVVWVKCAWKPGASGACAVQMAFPSKEHRPHTADDVINTVVEVTKRASERGATHLLLLAADDEGHTPLAAYLIPIDQIDVVIRQAVATNESLTRNGASPSLYVTAKGEHQAALVEIVKNSSIDLLARPQSRWLFPDAIDDLDVWPTGIVTPERTSRLSASYGGCPIGS